MRPSPGAERRAIVLIVDDDLQSRLRGALRGALLRPVASMAKKTIAVVGATPWLAANKERTPLG